MGKKYFNHPYRRATGNRRFQFFAEKKGGTFTKITIYCIILIFQTGCKVLSFKSSKKEKKKEVVSKNINIEKNSILSNDQKIDKYISEFAPIAIEEMKKFEIPASITLAQGLLESGYGEGRLALKGNNHFGIKCHKEWSGKKIYHDDDKKGECFRKYKDPKESYRDHSLFLTNRPRYAFLFDYNIKNYKQWAYGLKKAGYATDKKYPLKLINLIERLNLKRFDRQAKTNIKKDSNKKELFFYRVSKGDTLFSISKKFNIEIKTLVKMNQINDNKIYIGQELIITKK